jgi:hypothetical protein
MIATMRKIFSTQPLNSGDMLHIIEFTIVTFMVLYGVYTNSKEVPGLKDAVANIQMRVSVVETGQADMKSDFADIKRSLGRIENALLNRGKADDGG